MRAVKFFSITLGVIVFIAVFSEQSRAEFPEYTSQDSCSTNWHSGICTSDSKVVWDSAFAWMVTNPLGLTNQEAAFAFMECFGGGMIDELLPVIGKSSDVTSFTSASKHDKPAYYWSSYDASNNNESYYNKYYSQRAGGATVYNHGAAGQYGYDNDFVGPVVKNQDGNVVWEHPQYKFPCLLPNKTDVTLHRANISGDTPDAYRAIVFGGSTNQWANYNSVSRIYGDLKARGYTDAEIYLMYPANTKPNGAALPASWTVDDGTTYRDMLSAWTWMQNQSTATTQIYYWSSICHGNRTYDIVGAVWDDLNELIEVGVEYDFGLTGEFIDQVRDLFYFYGEGTGAISGTPYFQVIAPDMLTDLAVILNHKPLTFLEVTDLAGVGSDYLYKFALDEIDIANLQITSNSFEFNWTGGPVDFTMAGVTTGDMANPIPEPATLVLFAIAGLLIRKK